MYPWGGVISIVTTERHVRIWRDMFGVERPSVAYFSHLRHSGTVGKAGVPMLVYRSFSDIEYAI